MIWVEGIVGLAGIEVQVSEERIGRRPAQSFRLTSTGAAQPGANSSRGRLLRPQFEPITRRSEPYLLVTCVFFDSVKICVSEAGNWSNVPSIYAAS